MKAVLLKSLSYTHARTHARTHTHTSSSFGGQKAMKGQIFHLDFYQQNRFYMTASLDTTAAFQYSFRHFRPLLAKQPSAPVCCSIRRYIPQKKLVVRCTGITGMPCRNRYGQVLPVCRDEKNSCIDGQVLPGCRDEKKKRKKTRVLRCTCTVPQKTRTQVYRYSVTQCSSDQPEN